MSEAETISAVKLPNTTDSLYKELKAAGIVDGETLEVHSSMSKLGWVCGGAIAVIEALLKAVGSGGTVVMPSHSGDNSDPADWCMPPVPSEWWDIIRENMPPFDPRTSPTRNMGRIAEAFRTYPNTIRSNHPQTSFSANGAKAPDIAADQPLSPQFGMDSPVGRLYKINARVLLIGTGYDHCTCMHIAEALLPTKMIKYGSAIIENGQRVWKFWEDCELDSDRFPQIGDAFEREQPDKVVNFKLGAADCKLIDIKPLVDYSLSYLSKL